MTTHAASKLCHRFEISLMIACAIFLAVFTYTSPRLDNDLSRFAFVESLVDHGCWHIDNSQFHYKQPRGVAIVDRVRIGEHYYSTKPPVLSLLMAGAYQLLKTVSGLGFDSEPGRSLAIFSLTYLFCGIPFLFMLGCCRKALRWFEDDPVLRCTMFLLFALSTSTLGFSRTLNNHVPAAALFFYGFTSAVGIRLNHLSPTPWRLLAVGLAAGALPTLDLPAMFFCLALTVYLLWIVPMPRMFWFVVGALVPLSLHFWGTWAVSGSLLPIYLRKELYHQPGSYWLQPRYMDALDEPKSVVFYHLTVGRKGLWALCPLLLGLPVQLLRVANRQRPWLGWLTLAGLAVAMAFLGEIAWGFNRDIRHSSGYFRFFYALFTIWPVFAIAYLWQPWRPGRELSQLPLHLPLESAGIGALVFGWIVFYTFMSNNYGGAATGMRWFMFFTPTALWISLLTLAPLWKARSRHWLLLAVLVAVSGVSSWQAVVRPWSLNWDWTVRFLGFWVF